MSVEQLETLRSTIVRLKHLPFVKLTEVLFTETPEPDGDVQGTSCVREDSPVFAQEFFGHCESEMTRNLFEDVKLILKSKEDQTEQ